MRGKRDNILYKKRKVKGPLTSSPKRLDKSVVDSLAEEINNLVKTQSVTTYLINKHKDSREEINHNEFTKQLEDRLPFNRDLYEKLLQELESEFKEVGYYKQGRFEYNAFSLVWKLKMMKQKAQQELQKKTAILEENNQKRF